MLSEADSVLSQPQGWMRIVDRGVRASAMVISAAVIGALGLVAMVESPRQTVPSIPTMPEIQSMLTPWHIVQFETQLAPEVARVPDEVPLAALDITVVGILTRADRAVAFLRVAGRDEVVRVGDRLDESIEIYGITRTNVLIMHEGQLSRLPLRDVNVGAVAEQTVESPSSETIDLGLSSDIVQLQWRSDSAGVPGLGVTHLTAPIREVLGIEVDDVLIAVNGYAVSELIRAPQDHAAILMGDEVAVELERAGKRLIFSFATQTLMELWQRVHD